jgi:hypothetical protein
MTNHMSAFIPHINTIVDLCKEEKLTEVIQDMIELEIVEIIRIIILWYVETEIHIETFESMVLYYLKLRFMRLRKADESYWGYNHCIVEFMSKRFQEHFGRDFDVGIPKCQHD